MNEWTEAAKMPACLNGNGHARPYEVFHDPHDSLPSKSLYTELPAVKIVEASAPNAAAGRTESHLSSSV
jgi:hypothetical protein